MNELLDAALDLLFYSFLSKKHKLSAKLKVSRGANALMGIRHFLHNWKKTEMCSTARGGCSRPLDG